MGKIRTLTLVFFLAAGATVFSLEYQAYAVPCDAIVGKWTWFTGGVATVNPDGTMVYANPDGTTANDGSWECTDPSRGMFTLRWRIGGYVNSLTLSADGQGLSSTDPSQHYVTATRIRTDSKTEATAHFNEVSPEDSQEMARLAERISQNYYKDTLEFHSADGFFDDDSIRKEHSVSLGEDFVLVERYLECSIIGPEWRFGDDSRIPADYRMSAESVGDCDKNSYGLKWEEKTVRIPLMQIEPSSINVSEIDKDESGLKLGISFGYEDDPYAISSINCKDRSVCEQMAADLKRLVEIAQKYAGKKP